MTTRLRHDVVICTKDRPDELRACLASLAAQTRAPDRVLVVDASGADQSDLVADAASGGLDVRYRRSEPSTTRQRNLGIDEATGDIIHFLDDDVVLEPGYLEAIDAVYGADPQGTMLGVGGLPTNLATPAPTVSRRVLGARGRPGRVLPSGRGVPVLAADKAIDVDWLSGCCMSFRAVALGHERFDPRYGGEEGYALGEDLELSYRIRQRGRLVVTPAARLVHLESPRNRWDRRRWGRADVVNRYERVCSGVGAYRRSAFWLDGVAQLAWWTARGLRPDGGDARSTARGLAEGLLSVARGSSRGAGTAARPND
jgi:GT2 family glycosyltransferase